MKSFKVRFIGLLLACCILMAQTVVAGTHAVEKENTDGSRSYIIDNKDVSEEEWLDFVRNRTNYSGLWWTEEEWEEYTSYTYITGNPKYDDMIASTRQSFIVRGKFYGHVAWALTNPDGGKLYIINEREVTRQEYYDFIRDRMAVGGIWFTDEEYQDYRQAYALASEEDIVKKAIEERIAEGKSLTFQVSRGDITRYVIDGEEVTEEEYINDAVIYTLNGVRVSREDYESVFGSRSNSQQARSSFVGRDLTQIDLSSYHRPDVSFEVAYDLPWYNHQQKMYVGDSYSLGSLRSSKPLVEEATVEENQLGNVPFKLVYEAGTVLNFSYYREQDSDNFTAPWQILEDWDNYWADRLDHGMTVVVDTAFQASASRIAWGNEVTLTEDMIGKRLGLWFVGESFDNDHMITIELEVVPAGTLATTQQPPTTTVTFNNQPLNFDLPVINRDDRTYYPLRQLIEGIGGTVTWDGEVQKASGFLNDNEVNFFIDSNGYHINGVNATMDAVPFIENDRTYIPIRFAAEALGLTVEWDSDTMTIALH